MSLLSTADAGMIAEQVRTARIQPAEVAEHFWRTPMRAS